MEFYVVDPKDRGFDEWAEKVRTFLAEAELPYEETEGGLYYLGDDVATPWHEDSLLFVAKGEEGGVVEVRDVDKNFYVFTADLSMFGDRELEEGIGYHARTPTSVYGFKWGNAKSSRFHLGPSSEVSYLCQGDDADYPPVLNLEEAWLLLFRVMKWLGSSLSRMQDLQGVRAEKITLDFIVEATFSHPASLDALNEILAEEEGYERSKKGLRATFRDRDAAWISRFVAELPTDLDDFGDVLFRVVWRGQVDGKQHEITYCGIERRNLRPFVQMPLHATSKSFVDKIRTAFKGHRIDRQEYLIG